MSISLVESNVCLLKFTKLGCINETMPVSPPFVLQDSPLVMCVGTCTRVLGPCLLALALLSVTASILLLFPSWEWHYLKVGRITQKAMLMPGVWGGGLLVSGYSFPEGSLSRIWVENSHTLPAFCSWCAFSPTQVLEWGKLHCCHYSFREVAYVLCPVIAIHKSWSPKCSLKVVAEIQKRCDLLQIHTGVSEAYKSPSPPKNTNSSLSSPPSPNICGSWMKA